MELVRTDGPVRRRIEQDQVGRCALLQGAARDTEQPGRIPGHERNQFGQGEQPRHDQLGITDRKGGFQAHRAVGSLHKIGFLLRGMGGVIGGDDGQGTVL